MACRALTRRLASLKQSDISRTPLSARSFATSSAAVANRPQSGDVDTRDARRVPASARAKPWGFLPDLFSFPFGRAQRMSLMQMMDTVDKLFDSSLFPVSSAAGSRSLNRMPWDVMEDEKCFKLRVDVPGVSKDEVRVGLENGDLTVKAEHKAEEDEDDWSSRSHGSYNLRIQLPENVDQSAIKAELKDGVLKIVAPKVEGKTEKIDVQVN